MQLNKETNILNRNTDKEALAEKQYLQNGH
jgi:hypothetical protein